MSLPTVNSESLAGLRIIVAEDEADLRLGMTRLLGRLGAAVVAAEDGAAALSAMQQCPADLVLTDLMMPRLSGSELLAAVKEKYPATEVVIFTGFGTIQTAVACLRAGAAHFLTKPFDNDEVLQIVGRLGRQLLAARAATTAPGSPELVAEDPAMLRVLDLVERAARTQVPVLIEGESGTGKEMIARHLHARSAVKDRPFLAVNTAALPDTLLEAELFGHKKGAFTGADRERDGLFQEAKKGTIFLDEIASMSPAFQGKLLRVLQEKVVRPLGGTAELPVEFRLVAASHRDLEALIRSGEFREDLFYRLSVVRVRLPPLRERPRDLTPLALLFARKSAKTCLGDDARVPTFSDAALAALAAHRWPGNVRELENAVQRALVVCTGDVILAHHLGLGASEAGSGEPTELDYNAGKQVAIERFQREYLQRALERTGGNITQAAERCGMTRAALQRILARIKLPAPDVGRG